MQSSNHWACHMSCMITVVLSLLGLAFSRSRHAKGSTNLSLPDWISRYGAPNSRKSFLVLAIMPRSTLTVLGQSRPWQMQGSFLEQLSKRYLLPFLPVCFSSCWQGRRKEKRTVSFLRKGQCWLFARIDGLNRMPPFAIFGFLRRTWKVTAPPRLMPERNTFRSGYLFLTRMMNCSLVVTNSSKESMQPRLGPQDWPKLGKSQPVIIYPSPTRWLASSPLIPVCPLREWRKITTALGLTLFCGYQVCVISLVPWQSQYSFIGQYGIFLLNSMSVFLRLFILKSSSSRSERGMLLKYSQSSWNLSRWRLSGLEKREEVRWVRWRELRRIERIQGNNINTIISQQMVGQCVKGCWPFQATQTRQDSK